MLRANIPTKFPKAFGAQAGGAYIRQIPTASQIGIQAGAASLTDGFPPLTMTPLASGGIPPFGQDTNGILNQITLWNQWQQMGGAVPYDSAFQTQIGGYPAGAVVESAVTLGAFFISTVDNNLTNPDTGGAGWSIPNAGRIGIVTMQFIGAVGAGGAWVVNTPNGGVLNIAGSTTNGLQEAINYAVGNGFRLEVYGQGSSVVASETGTLNGTNIITGLSSTSNLAVGNFVTAQAGGIQPGTQITSIDSSSQIHISLAATASGSRALKFAQNQVFIACTTQVTFPPTEQWTCEFTNVNITFTSAAPNGLVFDSMIICDISFLGGQIVYEGNGYAVVFAPTNPIVLDGFITIGTATVLISNIATPTLSGNAAGVVGFNCSNGGILNNLFAFGELNGAGGPGSPSTCPVGLAVFGQTASNGFEQNIFDIGEIHEVTSAGVQVGTNNVAASVLRQNIWQIGAIHPAGSSSSGFNTWGSQDIILIGGITSEEGTLFDGLVFQSSAASNQAHVGGIVGATNNVIESVYGSNYLYGPALRTSNYGSTKGHTTNPDGTITQYINNASGTTGGTTTTFDIPFPTEILAITATPQNLTSGFQATSSGLTGVTITTASSSGTFAVIAIGR